MKKRITIITSLILSIFLLVGCNSNNNQSDNKAEIASNYLKVKTAIGNYAAETNFSQIDTGIINKDTYNIIIRALESLNAIIENDKNIDQGMRNELIEINNPLIEYCEARSNDDKTNEGYAKSIVLENEFREKYNIKTSKIIEKNDIENNDKEEQNSDITLESSKNELENMANKILDADGSLRYISGEILSDLKTITIPVKNDESGKVEDKEIEVFEFMFVTMDNERHYIYLSIEDMSKKTNYKKGDSIYFKLTDSLNSGWYIGENKEVLYLLIIEN